MGIEKAGFGVQIEFLKGNEDSVKAWKAAEGKVIAKLGIVDDNLQFVMEDGTKLVLRDDGQSCCEHRYMVCDDALAPFVGAKLLKAEVRAADDKHDEYGEHEVAFLIVKTSAGDFTVANHNEHNGYYGGFAIRAHG